jgi:tetratricopeptide (TPR) repeat protein
MESASAEHHLAHASALIELRRYQDCIKSAEKALAINPSEAVAHLLISQSYSRMPGHLYKALTHAENAVRLAPYSSDALAWYAVVLGLKGKKRRAVEVANATLAVNPQEKLAYLARAQARNGFDKWIKAEADIRSALALNPDDIVAQGMLAQALRLQDRFEESRAVLDATLSKAPRDPFSLVTAGWLALEHNDQRLAVRYVESALSIDPMDEFARRTWREICRRSVRVYRWQKIWQASSIWVLGEFNFKKHPWLWLLVVIPHAGILLGFFGVVVFIAGFCFWAIACCTADFFLALNPRSRRVMTTTEFCTEMGKGLLLVPLAIYLLLTVPLLRGFALFAVLLTLLVAITALILRKCHNAYVRFRGNSTPAASVAPTSPG